VSDLPCPYESLADTIGALESAGQSTGGQTSVTVETVADSIYYLSAYQFFLEVSMQGEGQY
jgi:hypothetical protein